MLVDFYMMELPLPVRGPAESEAPSKVVKLGFDTLKNAKATLMLNLNVSMNGLCIYIYIYSRCMFAGI